MSPAYDEALVLNRSKRDPGRGRATSTPGVHSALHKQSEHPDVPDDDRSLGRPETPEEPAAYNNINGVHQEPTEDLPALQVQGPPDAADNYEPVLEDQPGSYDLVEPAQTEHQVFSLEKLSLALFSKQHLHVIFSDPSLLLRFTAFISAHRPHSVPLLVHYLDALKAIRAIHYANAVTEALEPLQGHDFTAQNVPHATNEALEKRAEQAFEVLVNEELPAYITHLYITVVSESISRRIAGTLPAHLREASEGLAEVFCLTDPSRRDNPIVFASEEFHRTTQYGMDYVLGRNCRFLQGPHTNVQSINRIRDSVHKGYQHQEVFLNYRRDGSPFVNLLMMAPLCDSRGKIRYFIGAQVDVSGLVKECVQLEFFARLLEEREAQEQAGEPVQNGLVNGNGANGHIETTTTNDDRHPMSADDKDEFRALSEMLNLGELSTVKKYGGRMHTDRSIDDASSMHGEPKPRLLLREPSPDEITDFRSGTVGRLSGKLGGVYKHYLLVRPHPSMRILFASPSQRVPGILQSPFLSRVGGSPAIRDELAAAFAEGRGVTAKIRWISNLHSQRSFHDLAARNRADEERILAAAEESAQVPQGRPRWIHCTPLTGAGGKVGVWMVVMVLPDEDEKQLPALAMGPRGKGRLPPPVQPQQQPQRERMVRQDSTYGPDGGRNGATSRASQRFAADDRGMDHATSRMGDIRIESPHNRRPYRPGAGDGYAGSNGSYGSRRSSFHSQGGESLTSLRIT